MTELSDIMKSLVYTERVQIMTILGKQGYMSKHIESKSWASDLIDPKFLTKEERDNL
jgi:hypothetical protein